MAVIKGGTLYTMGKAGVIEADLRIEDGKIVEIGAGLEPSAGEEVIDATGKAVTPGFVDAHSHVGGIEGENEDLNELTNPRTPELDALYGVNPASKYFGVALEQGITTSLIIPGSGNVIGGWGSCLQVGRCLARRAHRASPGGAQGRHGHQPQGRLLQERSSFP